MKISDESTKGVIIQVLKQTENEYHFLFLLRSGGRFKGQWWPVAGTCEKNEKPVDTVLRELKEETGLSPIKIYKSGEVITHADRVSKLEGFVVFVSPDSVVELNHEHSDYKWLTVQEVFKFVPVINRSNIQHIESNFIKRSPRETLCVWCST